MYLITVSDLSKTDVAQLLKQIKPLGVGVRVINDDTNRCFDYNSPAYQPREVKYVNPNDVLDNLYALRAQLMPIHWTDNPVAYDIYTKVLESIDLCTSAINTLF